MRLTLRIEATPLERAAFWPVRHVSRTAEVFFKLTERLLIAAALSVSS